MHTAQLHSCSSEMDVYLLQISLWGFEYSQKIEITPNQEKSQRVHLKKREGSIELLSLDVIVSNLSITIQAPYQILNKTPFSLYVLKSFSSFRLVSSIRNFAFFGSLSSS